jgi:hypothetical protein
MLGSYRTPRVRIGQTVECELRGPVIVTSIADSPIQWPWARGKQGRTSPVVYKDLAKALRVETGVDICKAWGIANCTVRKWRKRLGISGYTPGLIERLRQHMLGPVGRRMHRLAAPTLRSPARRAKIAASKLGKKRPKEAVEARRRKLLGRPLSASHRRKLSEAQRRRGTRPPKAGRPWTEQENEWLRTLPPVEVAKRTKRTIGAVWCQRQKLELPDGRASNGRRPSQ